MPREYLEGNPRQEQRAFSPAVITKGGKQVWLAGVGRTVDGEGNQLHGDFGAQVHASFRAIQEVLQRAAFEERTCSEWASIYTSRRATTGPT